MRSGGTCGASAHRSSAGQWNQQNGDDDAQQDPRRTYPCNPVDFVGPHTLSYYGQPVPIEDGHIAPCPSVMSYRECSAETPSELDWAVLRDLGYRVLR